MNKITTTKFKDHQEWLELRRQGIGGSDAATIVGLNKWESPYHLWLDKLGKVKPEKDNEAMRQGRDLEEYVARRFAEETGKKVRKRNGIIRNSDYPFALANVDRWIVGENAGLECKTINRQYWSKFEEGEFPDYYYIQCMHYMAVTGADKYYLAIVVLGSDFKVFEIERDEEAIRDLMILEKEFWELVETKTPPAVDGTDITDDALLAQYSEPVEDQKIILFDMNEEADRLADLKREKKELDRQIKTIEQNIKERIGDSVYGETDRYEFSWKPHERRAFQIKEFIKDHPDIDLDPYYKVSKSRVFRAKEL